MPPPGARAFRNFASRPFCRRRAGGRAAAGPGEDERKRRGAEGRRGEERSKIRTFRWRRRCDATPRPRAGPGRPRRRQRCVPRSATTRAAAGAPGRAKRRGGRRLGPAVSFRRLGGVEGDAHLGDSTRGRPWRSSDTARGRRGTSTGSCPCGIALRGVSPARGARRTGAEGAYRRRRRP